MSEKRRRAEGRRAKKVHGVCTTKEWAGSDQTATEHKREHEKRKRGREEREKKKAI